MNNFLFGPCECCFTLRLVLIILLPISNHILKISLSWLVETNVPHIRRAGNNSVTSILHNPAEIRAVIVAVDGVVLDIVVEKTGSPLSSKT